VMPYIEGETLRDKLNRETQLGIEEAVRITTEVADALDYAHRHGVIHRDIKPENILLHDGRPMVADFGIALALSAAAGGRMTETGLSLGTPHYMSPEQATADKEITGRSDIYSLASVLYEMLTGEPPHSGGSAQAIIMKIVTEEAAPVTTRRKSVPPNVAAALGKALEKVPADRFPMAKEFADALVNPGFSTQKAGVGAPGSRSWLTDWRSRLALGIAAVSLAAVVALLVLGRGYHRAMARMSVAQITFGEETIFTARWAPDGKTVVYSSARVGLMPRLYVVRPDYPEPQPLGPDSIQLLAVSAQGELALLTRPRLVGRQLFLGTLARMPLGGGAPREVMENVNQADWSPDGSRLAIMRPVGDRVQLEYPVGRVLYRSRSGGYVSGLRISPAGDRIAFFDHPHQLDDRGVVMVVDTAGKATVISPEFHGLEGLAWEPGGKSVLFSGVSVGGMYQIHQAGVGQAVRLVLPSPGTLTLGDVAGDGRWLVSRDDAPFRIMAHVPGSPGLRNLSWLDDSWSPRISGDGSLVAFTDESPTGGPRYSVMIRKTDGSPVVRLGDGSVAAWSPDKRWVLGSLPTAPTQWVLYPTGPGEARTLQWTVLEAVTAVNFFPDSRSLLVCGHEPGKAPRCYRSPLDASSLEPVTPDSVGSGLVRPDGHAIAYRAEDGWRIYPLGGGPPRLVPDSKGAQVLRWSPDGTALWLVTTLGVKLGAERMEVASGRRTPLPAIELPTDFRIFAAFNLSLADDPHYYAYNTWSYSSRLFAIQGVR
ncbi:MAG TPA: protein kinase, partial [Gemmatimonadales bacterium]|nr:protein kinase [Gemmatimonadales bacterium]